MQQCITVIIVTFQMDLGRIVLTISPISAQNTVHIYIRLFGLTSAALQQGIQLECEPIPSNPVIVNTSFIAGS